MRARPGVVTAGFAGLLALGLVAARGGGRSQAAPPPAGPGAATGRPAGAVGWVVDPAGEPAFQAARRRADTDGDGRLEAGEWTRIGYGAPDFAAIDRDGDGDLTLAELSVKVLRLDPVDFDGRGYSPPPRGPESDRRPPGAERGGAEELRQALRLLREGVLAVDRRARVPTGAEIDGCGLDQGLAGPRVRAVVARLEAAWKEAGLEFPIALAPPGTPTPGAGGAPSVRGGDR